MNHDDEEQEAMRRLAAEVEKNCPHGTGPMAYMLSGCDKCRIAKLERQLAEAQVDLSTARQSLYAVVDQRNQALREKAEETTQRMEAESYRARAKQRATEAEAARDAALADQRDADDDLRRILHILDDEQATSAELKREAVEHITALQESTRLMRETITAHERIEAGLKAHIETLREALEAIAGNLLYDKMTVDALSLQAQQALATTAATWLLRKARAFVVHSEKMAVTFRNYYASAISRAAVDDTLVEWREALAALYAALPGMKP